MKLRWESIRPSRSSLILDECQSDNPAGLAALKRFGTDAVSFQGLETAMTWWHDDPTPIGTGASLAYFDTGRSWLAVGSPLVALAHRAEAATRFARAAGAQHRRVVFFGIENLTPFGSFQRIQIGLQSVVEPARWQATLAGSRKLREQLRRARAKGVTVRLVAAAELAEGTDLRREVDRLRSQWLATRAIEPMGFLVAVEPFHFPEEHLYVVAERNGHAVQFLSAVPVYERSGWLLEDMLRGPDAPNGTTELVLDLVMRHVGEKCSFITPGLTPLVGDVPWWLRIGRFAIGPLYDFRGLERFRARLSPRRWDPVWLVWDRGYAPLVLIESFSAFASAHPASFVWRSLVLHPNGPPWAVAVPLVPWTVLLAILAATGHTDALGFSRIAVVGWVGFDAGLAWLLFRTARRPRIRALLGLALITAFDAVISCYQLSRSGFGSDTASVILRVIGTAGPVIGTAALVWAAWRARVAQSRRRS